MIGRELWVTDGTASGTQMLADIYPGVLSSNPGEFHVFDGLLYFSAADDTHGVELWRTDGTAGGTERVSDINPRYGNASPTHLFDVNDHLYFLAYRPSDGREFWRLEGTRSGGGPGSGCSVQSENGGALAMLIVAVMAAGLARRRGIPLGSRRD